MGFLALRMPILALAFSVKVVKRAWFYLVKQISNPGIVPENFGIRVKYFYAQIFQTH
jgi:hypothetical protein